MRIVLVISVWLLLAAVFLNFLDLRKKNEALIERMESLEQAVEGSEAGRRSLAAEE